MIRMGRSSRPDQSDAPNYQGGSSNNSGISAASGASSSAYQYGAEAAQASSRVVTDSESIARDIKEGRLSGFVGHGTTLTGDTNFQMMLRVDGHLTGTVSSDGGTLIVGTNGQVDANVAVSVATINGTVNGDVTATEKIQLGRTARVIGNISTPRLVIEEGAIFEGGCVMLKARETQESQLAAAAQQSQAAQYRPNESASFAAATDDDDDDSDEYLDADDDESEDEKAEAALI